MPFDLAPSPSKRRAGKTAYLSGLAAEDIVANHYRSLGYAVEKKRWRGRCGEIDLILSGANGLVFVEVKKARDFETAATRLTFSQLHRIAASAEDYIGTECTDPFTLSRLDLAMVNDQGCVKVLENLTLY